MDPTSSKPVVLKPGPRRRRRHPVRVTVLTLLVVLSFTAGAGVDRVGWLGGSGAAADSSFTNIAQFQTLEETYNAIRAHYVDSKDITDAELLYGAASGMVNALGDTGHSTFLTPDEAKQQDQELNGELIGIGVYVDSSGMQPVVIAPIPDSPAMRAGIKSGDTIVAINGTETRTTDPSQWTTMIRGDAGTPVTLTIEHAGATTTEDVKITRAKIKVNPVSWKMLPDHVAWIQLTEFSTGAGDQIELALTAAKKAGAKGVILDLRNNPGGYVSEADKVASQFMPKGSVLFKEQDRSGDVSSYRTTGSNGAWLKGPLVVLVNGNSASAAEIVSASLHDNKRATLIGETTVGMGTVLTPYTLSDGSQAVLGVSIFLAPSGQQIWKKGVTPDKEVGLKAGIMATMTQEFEGDTVTIAEIKQAQDQQLLSGYSYVVNLLSPATS
jgi:carboxyl-terminal processing protease